MDGFSSDDEYDSQEDRDTLLASRVTFVGAGKMAEAIYVGLLADGVDAAQVSFVDPHRERLDYLAENLDNTSPDNMAEPGTPDAIRAVSESDLVVVSCKPQNLPSVFGDLRGSLDPQSLLLSVCAGVRVQRLVEGLDHARVVRCSKSSDPGKARAPTSPDPHHRNENSETIR